MSGPGRIVLSVSTWQQPMPPPPGPARAEVVAGVADRVEALGRRRVRVAVDGMTAAGKTSFGHELAAALADRGRVVLRASLDDFKRPWREAHLYDRVSGEGYYRNAFDHEAMWRLLLDPASPDGSGSVALCSIDPITQIDHRTTTVEMPDDGVLVVDGVFALRDELRRAWDLTVWLEVDPELSVRRGVDRDTDAEGGRDEAEALHRGRYLAAELLYLDEVDPRSHADVVVDNSDFDAPVLRT
jgi:uridine kinase